MNQVITVSDPVPDGSGVNITWKTQGPSDFELSMMGDVTESRVAEFSIQETEETVFFPIPVPISVHHTSMRRKLIPEQKSKWICVSFLLQSQEDDTTAAQLDGVDFDNL